MSSSSSQQMVLGYAQCMLILQMALTLWCITGVYVTNAQVDPAFYTELNVSRNATTLQIRKAFRKAALKLHPEKHKDDAACVHAVYSQHSPAALHAETRARASPVFAVGLPARPTILYCQKAISAPNIAL